MSIKNVIFEYNQLLVWNITKKYLILSIIMINLYLNIEIRLSN
uniref:Uncharacterized protein n=1 Tax=Lepeophtheirus salmonis TaxID=72036 RepID=A0A0K2UCV5_LEPSM